MSIVLVESQVRSFVFSSWIESDLPLQRLQGFSGHMSDVMFSVYNKPCLERTLEEHRLIKDQ